MIAAKALKPDLFQAGIIRLLIVLAVLLLPLLQSAIAAVPAIPSVIVLPPVNRTDNSSLNWLSIGIQDTMTVDLFGVSSVRPRALTEYGREMNYNLARISTFDAKEAVELAKGAKADLVWCGWFYVVDRDNVVLNYSAYDAANGALLHQQAISGALVETAFIASKMTAALLSGCDIPVTEHDLSRISRTKTVSFKAFEQNSLGFALQLQQFVKKGHMTSDRGGWIDHCNNAVQIDPQYAEAYVNLGWAHYSDRSFDAALTAFKEAVTRKPHLLDGWMGLGYVYRNGGKLGMAVNAFQKALAINGNLEWPQKELEKLVTTPLPDTAKVESGRQMTAAASLQDFERTLSPEERQLLALSANGAPEIRINAIKTLARAKGINSMPFLEQMIKKPDQAFEVLKIMVDIDVPASAPFLIEALEKHIVPDGTSLSGLSEQNILGVIQLVMRRPFLSQLVPVLTRLLGDASTAIRESAALTLGDLGRKEAVEPLRKFVASEKSQMARMSALVALARLGDEESRETLRNIISEGKYMNAINYAVKLMKQRKMKIGER